MSVVIDNLIAYKVLSMLVKPFTETGAFKMGIIDAEGNNLIKSRDLTTIDQKSEYTYLHKMCFNLKKLLNKLPGGDSKLKNIVAAFFLIKESLHDEYTVINEGALHHLVSLIEQGIVFAEEQLVVEEFMLVEEMGAGAVGVANVTGAAVSTDIPVIRKPKRFAKVKVNDDVFDKFAAGKAKHRKWSQYLKLESDDQHAIYQFARKNPNQAISLHNGDRSKIIQYDR